jgi:homoserine O-acetyltransferase
MIQAKNEYLDSSRHVGLVKEKSFTFSEQFALEGGHLNGFTLAYETYGELNSDGDNGILICHALTGDHHVAGVYSESDTKPGWWNHVVGPGKPIDTNKFFVICSNCLGGCRGSSGPSTISSNDELYGADFPDFSIGDMVRAQKLLLEHLNVFNLFAVVGGSMGGMQALQWIFEYPDFSKKAIIIAATAQHSVQTIAFNEAGRRSVKGDPEWKEGNYDKGKGPGNGLSVARMMAHITYLSDQGMEEKFGGEKRLDVESDFEFSVQRYLDYQGDKFIKRFDANSYLKLTEALDRFDLVGEKGLSENLKNVEASTLVISFSSDWLYTPEQNKRIATALHTQGKSASYIQIEDMHGHDSFLIDSVPFLKAVRFFLQGTNSEEAERSDLDGFRKLKNRYEVKKEADFKVIDNWVEDGSKVLDLGCGRGLLLEHLRETKGVSGLGFDLDLEKAISCISRGVAVNQEDIRRGLQNFEDNSFDWVIFSRMVEELPEPGLVLKEALRVGKRVAVSFVNHGYWKNRINFIFQGKRVHNEVYPHQWESSHLSNHFSIGEFEEFCNTIKDKSSGYSARIGRKVFHLGDWVGVCNWLPNLRAGLAIYEILKEKV